MKQEENSFSEDEDVLINQDGSKIIKSREFMDNHQAQVSQVDETMRLDESTYPLQVHQE